MSANYAAEADLRRARLLEGLEGLQLLRLRHPEVLEGPRRFLQHRQRGGLGLALLSCDDTWRTRCRRYPHGGV